MTSSAVEHALRWADGMATAQGQGQDFLTAPLLERSPFWPAFVRCPAATGPQPVPGSGDQGAPALRSL